MRDRVMIIVCLDGEDEIPKLRGKRKLKKHLAFWQHQSKPEDEDGIAISIQFRFIREDKLLSVDPKTGRLLNPKQSEELNAKFDKAMKSEWLSGEKCEEAVAGVLKRLRQRFEKRTKRTRKTVPKTVTINDEED